MHGITPGFSLQRGVALKWLLMAAIAMVAIATMVVAATAQAQSSNAPNPPTGLMAEIVTANSIRIAWQPPASNNCQVSQYNVLVEAKLSNDYIVDDYVPGSQHQYLIDNLDPATPHEIRVYAHSEDDGCSDGSTPALLEVVTKAGQAPAVSRTSTPGEPVAPKPLNVPSQPQNVGYEIGHNQLTVTWEQSTVSGSCGLVEYIALIVEWDGDPNKAVDQSSYREQKIAANASPAAVFENLKPETAYYTYLAARGDGACDGNGYSPKVEHYFTTKPVPTQAPTQAPTAEPTPDDGIEEATRTPEDQTPMPQVESPTSTPTVPGPVGNLAAKQTGWISAAESGSDRGYKRAVIYVTWDTPEDDGGSPIIGYDMEIMRGGNGNTIGPLTQLVNYKFGSANGVWKNDREADWTDLTHTTGRPGGTIVLGREGQWLEYRIGAANELGAGEIKKVQIQVEEHTVPGPVGNLAAKQTGWLSAAESGSDRGYKQAVIYVTWDTPEDDGGRPIIGYDVEIMRGGNGDAIGPLTQLVNLKFGSANGVWKNDREADWTDLTHTTGRPGGTIVLGREGQWLEYRIGAANTLGAGEITKVQIQVEEHTTPGPVGNLAAKQTGWIPAAESGAGYDQAVISVTWEPPADDGGRPIIGYDMEIMRGGNGNAIGALTQVSNYKVGSDNGVWKNPEETDMTDLTHTTGRPGGTIVLGRDGQWLEYRIGAANTLGAGEITKVQVQVDQEVRDVIFVEVVKDGTVYGNSKGLQSTFNVTEGDSGITTVPIQVRLTGRPSAEVNVRFMFHKPNDTEVQGRWQARANRAFHYMHLTLTWAANASGADLSKTLNLKIVGDTKDEDDEVVRLRVQEIVGTDISSDDRVRISRNGKKHGIQVVIVDDDGE